jgi:hypothetical protein
MKTRLRNSRNDKQRSIINCFLRISLRQFSEAQETNPETPRKSAWARPRILTMTSLYATINGDAPRKIKIYPLGATRQPAF